MRIFLQNILGQNLNLAQNIQSYYRLSASTRVKRVYYIVIKNTNSVFIIIAHQSSHDKIQKSNIKLNTI
jgi:hypothetical protein